MIKKMNFEKWIWKLKKFIKLPNLLKSPILFQKRAQSRTLLEFGRALSLIDLYFIFIFFQLEYAFQESGLNDVITQSQVEVPHLNPTKVSEKMSCETSDIFFPNLAYMWPIIDRIIQYFYIKYVPLILGQFISTIYGI